MQPYSRLTAIVICRYVNARNWGDVSRALRRSMSLNDIDYLAALETENRAGNSIVPEVRRLIFSNSGNIEEALAYESSVEAHIAVAGVRVEGQPSISPNIIADDMDYPQEELGELDLTQSNDAIIDGDASGDQTPVVPPTNEAIKNPRTEEEHECAPIIQQWYRQHSQRKKINSSRTKTDQLSRLYDACAANVLQIKSIGEVRAYIRFIMAVRDPLPHV